MYALLSLLLASAAEAHPTGTLPVDRATYLAIEDAENMPSAADGAALPRRIDWSGSFPKPGSQGTQGSCVGWAVGYGLKSFQEERERGWDPNQAPHQFSPSYLYNQVKQPGGGAKIVDALDLLVARGVPPITRFPYDVTDDSRRPDAAVAQEGYPYRVVGYRRVDLESTRGTRLQLASGNPVLISMGVYPAFDTFSGAGTYKTISGDKEGSHAMVVVGYDDERRAFRLLNSWGTAWGDEGYAWIDYDAFLQLVTEAYVVQDLVLPGPVADARPLESHVDAEADKPVTATLSELRVESGVARNGVLGLMLHTKLNVRDGLGRKIFVGANFSKGGQWLADTDGNFASAAGLVQVGEVANAAYPHSEWTDFKLFMPYSQLHAGVGDQTLAATWFVEDRGTAKPVRIAVSEPLSFTYADQSPRIELKTSWLEHGVERGGKPGMTVHTSLDAVHLQGKKIELRARFFDAAGKPLVDFDGVASCGSEQVVVCGDGAPAYDHSVYQDWQLWLELDQLHTYAAQKEPFSVRIEARGPGGEVLATGPAVSFNYETGGAPLARFGDLRLEHNVPLAAGQGMRIHVPLDVYNRKGRQLHAVAYFAFEGGQVLKSADGIFQTGDGQVSARAELTPGYDSSRYEDVVIEIPYGELHLAEGAHRLMVDLQLFDMSGPSALHLARSKPATFQATR